MARFEDTALRARLRVDLLLALYSARLNPLDVPAQMAHSRLAEALFPDRDMLTALARKGFPGPAGPPFTQA